ncbi:MAG TPA: dTMP kinase [Bryobacteraceae bacterium]|nr:dTMP kinase [Bryobacteraceae bacterium]
MSTTERRARRPGLFITFEGGDGAGKSTQMRLLAQRLRATGREVVETVEPGGTEIGNQIRRVLLDRRNRGMSAMTEMLLYFAARAQNLEEVIIPALERDAVVLSDRYTDSTLAYQSGGRSLGDDLVLGLHEIACRGMWPDLTICIDVDSSVGLARRHAAGEVNRLDEEAAEFHSRVREAYLDLARQDPERVKVVDGAAEPEIVSEQVWSVVKPHV